MEEVMVEDPLASTQDEVLFEGGPGAGDAVPAAPLALYRRYRPDTFADVIGQDHVTEPLQRALANNRVNHAYLFSGPRGCGKTTSARILARALNCQRGPAAEPCGQCGSCTDLARGGPGSIDVIEIDAASHGGVDDARELRERAFFAPVQSRYKIYIVDEAHMVTTAGFNALLKLVEEPPPHVKFIFATTEPDKVIGTIRSRTHHYPFRLVPPRTLGGYLARICEAEGIRVEPTVLPLVVRAGAGSVRDSLSVLDQLLGGAGENGVSYQQAAALLGYTPDSLLDEFVDAFAAGDAGGVFACVDKIIEVGQDPRRFGEDLLRRLRDLVIVAAVPDALASGLVDVAADQGERLTTQAAALGPGELTRAAEVIATGLTEMRGTTAPRLHLELMCARVLLPGADVDDRGIHARLDRLERRIGVAAQPADSGEPIPPAQPASAAPRPNAPERAEPVPPLASPGASSISERAGRAAEPSAAPPSSPVDTAVGQPSKSATLSVTDVRRLWPQVLEEVKGKRRFTWILLSQNAQVTEVRDGCLVLSMANAGARDSFSKGGSEDILREALIVVLGADLRIETTLDTGAFAARTPDIGAAASRTPHAAPQAAGPAADAASPRTPEAGAAPTGRVGQASAVEAAAASWAAEPPRPGAGGPTSTSGAAAGDQPSPVTPPTVDPAVRAQTRQSIRPTRSGRPEEPSEDDRDAAAARDDTVLDEDPESHTELLARHLGAEIIAEEEDGA